MNLDTIKTPAILFLRGCFIEQLKDLENEEPVFISEEVEVYEPKLMFYLKSEWIKKTKYRCGKCQKKIKGSPKCLPLSLSKTTNNEYEFSIDKNYYCSWICVDKCTSPHDFDKLEILEKLKAIW